MFGWLHSEEKAAFSNEEIDNVNISKEGIVSLNLQNENVKKRVKDQVLKLKNFDEKLLAHR